MRSQVTPGPTLALNQGVSAGKVDFEVMRLIRRLAIAMVATLGLQACTSGICLDRFGGYSGAQVFQTYCASCHGSDARGDGPVAQFLKVSVPDLTRIARDNGGQFPADKVYRIIEGESVQGARHMPIWGYEFFGKGEEQIAHREATDKMKKLVKYLRALQRPE